MDLIKFGRNSLGFRGMMGRTHKRTTRGSSRSDYGELVLSSGGVRRIKFATKRGGAYSTTAGLVKVALYQRTTTPWYLCIVYYNGSAVGGTNSFNGSSGLAGMVGVINANTTNSLNSNIVATLLSEANAEFHDSTDLADSQAFTSN